MAIATRTPDYLDPSKRNTHTSAPKSTALAVPGFSVGWYQPQGDKPAHPAIGRQFHLNPVANNRLSEPNSGLTADTGLLRIVADCRSSHPFDR
jgi:hypothetical protein